MDSWHQKSDNDLIKLALSGECKAYDVLFARHKEKVSCLIKIHLEDQEAVVDLVQDVLIKAYVYLPDFHESCQFSTWLHSITLNSIKNFYRKRNSREFSELHYTLEKNKDFHSPEIEAIGMELNFRLQSCLENLPKKLQECYSLILIEGYSYEEIARFLNCPLGTVKSRISRARELIINSIYSP